jgi:hypothetical protein
MARGSIAVLFTTDPCGARFPRGKVIVLVSPRRAATDGGIIPGSSSVVPKHETGHLNSLWGAETGSVPLTCRLMARAR